MDIQSYSFIHDNRFQNMNNSHDYIISSENIPCEGIGIDPNSKNSCCPLDWCEDIPAVTIPQFVLGWIIGTLGYAYSTAFTISVISKMIGQQSQVSNYP